jgi:ribosomal protein S18 acetylase RimI-like enzyme
MSATQDWRDVSATEVLPLLQAERRRWLETLHWDLGPALKLVEAARLRGEVPGLVLRDSDGRASGWAFYLLAGRQLQIGAVQASTAAGVRQLLDGILAAPEAELASSLSCFLYPGSKSVASALVRLRFELQEHHYLEANLAAMPGLDQAMDDTALTPLRTEDGAAAVRLLARAYAGDPAGRAFAPNARLDEWAQYLGQIFATPSVGAWLPAASLVAPSGSLDGLSGLVVTTEVARGIAHIAQVVVDPTERRQGLGRRLLLAASSRAASLGAKRITLIVNDQNAAARALYASLGFSSRGTFLFGQRGPVPRRVGGLTIRAGAAA